MGALDDLRLDLDRFGTEGRGRTAMDRLRIVLATEQVWVIVTYRLTRWAMRECRVPVVRMGPYAVVVRRIRIGDDVGIGANSLVISDLPDRAVAVGVPARVISRLGGGIPENPTVHHSETRPPAAVREARARVAGHPET